MRKQLLTAGIITAIGVTGAGSFAVVNAATDTNKTDPMSNLVSTIASKFNLDKTEVQEVFDEQRSTMEAEREAEAKAKVAELVKSGKLTQEKADKINTKRTELQKEREANRLTDQTKTDDERKAEMEAHRTELDTWLSSNGIDKEYAYLLMGGGGHGFGGPRGDKPAQD